MFKLSSRRITVSTVGIIEGIESLLSEGLYVNLALSLHAPNQKIRKKIIPSARKYPLEDLLRKYINDIPILEPKSKNFSEYSGTL